MTMKRKLLSILAVSLFLITLALTSLVVVQSAAAAGATRETVAVYTTPDGFLLGPAVPGAYATLVRNGKSLTTNIHTTVALAPGVYTVWWVVWNHPGNCATYQCTFDEPDLAV